MGADHQRRGHLGRGKCRTDRKPAAQCFGCGHDVGNDAIPFVGIELSCSAHTGLHFVQHHQRVMLVTQATDRLQKPGFRIQHPRFSLNRLDNDRTDVVRERGFKRRDVIERQVGNTARQRSKACPVVRLSAD